MTQTRQIRLHSASGPNIMYIMRGIPGSGKSTWVKEHVEHHQLRGDDVVVCSADNYFMKGNEYIFDVDKLHWAHSDCYNKAIDACARLVRVVIIDNTNIKRQEFKRYVRLAKDQGYNCYLVQMLPIDILTASSRNIHGVPLSVLERMINNYEIITEKELA